jgi:hypothetical protein
MSKVIFTAFISLSFFFPLSGSRNFAAETNPLETEPGNVDSGIRQRMIVETGSIRMELDMHVLNGLRSFADARATLGKQPKSQPLRLDFTAAPNSFFSILVFNNLLRGPESGSIALVRQTQVSPLPAILSASIDQLVLEKLSSDAAFDLAVRDNKTGFVFFNVAGQQYEYRPESQSLTITSGHLLLARDFAVALGRPSDAGASVGNISVGAVMQPIEVETVINGETTSAVMPPVPGTAEQQAPALVPGPDIIVGDLPQLQQGGNDTVNHLLDSEWEQRRVTMAISRLIDFNCLTQITRSSRKICIG